ncbi:putative quinol monooxygenase [Hymenobacter jeollabukensis]|uniref:Antibiotic biosynthesis monooxygenase n=1 Tax=Hymenobacter jeollabukensis TaxID=2025313 RepID=A0A5R8WGW6_9BACT|nr:putative quinol monooxygenase [Hymenobacter jeollabukensis]TLM87319.1 antibiotic biosynthesis monooxygenase [Hymenobacter jeollabukensis]
MLIRIVRMTFRPEAVAEFLDVFRASEDRIRQQPGCRHMELWQDAEQPHVFCTHSHWDSAADLDAYRRSALFGEVWPATKKLFAAPPLAFSVNPVTAATAQLPAAPAPLSPPDSVL